MNTYEDQQFMDNIASCSAILGTLFSKSPDAPNVLPLVERICQTDLAEEWPLGDPKELKRAREAFSSVSPERPGDLLREYRRQFVGPGHFPAPAWGSVYLDPDEVVFGSSTLDLQRWMSAHGIAVSSQGSGREPIDHIGKMLLLLSWIAENEPSFAEEYLERHLLPWSFRYFDLLEESCRHPFYQGLAILGRTTTDSIAHQMSINPSEKRLYH